ncbi:hypothetical protein [uncultured Bradyrhizobium sp.]|uniref:hypothetical protein n=1 Tax=uncultured Bradyrhizobium sp. TaxID=199684 RepID=UPI002621E189|nr:hypothetical protein [uncultured Bradyrhizobium sp.]
MPIELAEGKTIEGMKFVGLPKAASLGSFLFSRNFTWSAPDAEFHRLPPAQQVALFVLPAQAISDDLMIAGVDYDATIKGHSTKFHELAAAGGPILFGYATFLAVQPTDEGPWIEDRIRLCFSTSKDRSFCLEGRRAFGDASPALLTRTAS